MTSATDGSQRVLVGAGSLSRLGEAVRELGGRQAFLVTDAGVAAAGIVDAAVASMQSAAVDCCVFDRVRENPTSRLVEEATTQAGKLQGADIIIGLGGGSAMDCAKGVNFLLSNGGSMEDYRGDGRAPGAMFPSIGIPTTAGTGSEAQRFALISAEGSHEKMACGDRRARFRTVILDPELTRSVPAVTRAAVGIDALAHALESFVCTAADARSQHLSLEALRVLDGSFEDSMAATASAVTRTRMLLGAHWAGVAIEGSMLGATHACANPLTARYGTVHGVAIGVMLPHVIRFNAETAATSYTRLAAGLRSPARGAEAVAERVEALLQAASMPTRLGELEVVRDELPELAAAAAFQKTARYNPRQVTTAEALKLYEAAY